MAKKPKRQRRKKRVRKNDEVVPVAEETWLLMQEAADLIGEIHRLTQKASECQEQFRKTRCCKTMTRAMSRGR